MERTARIELRVTREEKQEFLKRAADRGISVSDLLREALDRPVTRRLDAVATAGGKVTIETAEPPLLTKQERWDAADEEYRRLQEEKHGPLV